MASPALLCVWFCLVTFSQFNFILGEPAETYIIHMDLSAMPKLFSEHRNWYAATLSSISDVSQISTTTTTKTSSSSKLLYTYSNAIHGFSAKLSSSELKMLEKSPGFISSVRDVQVTIDTTHTSEFLNLSPKSGAWPAGNYGKDIIVGLVDTGIWPESDSFRDDGMTEIPSRWKGECVSGTAFSSSLCNKKLIGAKYFNKGLVSHFPTLNISMNSTRDIDGHGTHTSSTAVGNYVEGVSYFGYGPGTAVGMAPLARVAMYKALWEAGSYTSDILAAIDQAIDDGVDVISLSLGLDGVPLHKDPVAVATFAAMEKGIFVATSAGNEGPWYGLLHNGIPWVLTVAAGSVDREYSGSVTLGNGDAIVGKSLYPGNSSLSQIPLVFMDSCNYTNAITKIGNGIAVCLDTDEAVGFQANNVKDAGIGGGLFITNSSSLELLLETSFPSIFLTLEDGQTVLDYIKNSSNPKASMKFKMTELGTKPAPRAAAYSSRGPSLSCPGVLKPDLMAPGTLVLAAWPQTTPVTTLGSQSVYSNFNLLSGTSMSCPHTAGIAALIKEAHPEWSPAAIRSALMTTADAVDNTGDPIKDIGDSYRVASPLARGSGQVNPNKALDPGLIYDANAEDYINLLCTLNYTLKQIQTITRTSAFNCSNKSSDLNYPSFIAFFNSNDTSSSATTVQEFRRTVTNVGNAKSTYTVTLTSMDGFEVTVMPGTLSFTEKNQKLNYTVTIEGPRMMKEIVVHGALTWVDNEGKYVVRSPMVATRLRSVPLANKGS
ncbi:subtilisin-like protease [Thalictrum thalictroides]|uniref:Subtilisin-like protease n=1 Tax=Thalictrum thalictroides TaxID=46969 RepID=A0A7J6W124_THATH|nr:subtilisin-like protease [Thalictrum thalictroides]